MSATSHIYAHLREVLSRTENPGVGGSIPSQPTIVFSPACTSLARAAPARRARCTRLTRPVLGPTRSYSNGSMTIEPVVLRPPMNSCAAAASRSGKVLTTLLATIPCATASNRDFAAASSSLRVDM
jgi:hypothetical protein